MPAVAPARDDLGMVGVTDEDDVVPLVLERLYLAIYPLQQYGARGVVEGDATLPQLLLELALVAVLGTRT